MTETAQPRSQTPASPAGPSTGLPAGPRSAIVWAFIALFGALFAWNAWKRDFWAPEEPLVAEVAREMERSGDWIVPSFEKPFLDLPPLAYWLAAGVHKLTGLDPRISYRLPAVLAAMAGLWLTFLAGKRLFDGRIGFLAVSIEASTFFFFHRAAWLDEDLIFAVACQLALTAFAFATRKGARRGWSAAGWAGLALAALAKSALLSAGLVFGSLLFFLFFEGGVGMVRRGFGRVCTLRGLTVFFVLAVPWYVAAAFNHGSELLAAHFLGHFRRLMNSPVDAKPPYFYLVTLVWAFLPWSIFLPTGILHGKDRIARDGERFALVWTLFMLIALSFVSAKKPGYALVVWPPLSLLIAAALFETREWFTVWEDFLRQGVLTIVPPLLKLPLFIVASSAAAYLTGYLEKLSDERLRQVLADRPAVLWSLGLAGAAAAVVFAVSYRVRRLVLAKDVTRAAFELACAAVFLFFVSGFFYGGINLFESSRPAMERFSASLPADARVAVYGEKRAEIFYYLRDGRDFTHLEYPDPLQNDDPAFKRLEELLKHPAPAFLIASRADLETLKSQFASLIPFLHEKDSARLGSGEEYVLVGNLGQRK